MKHANCKRKQKWLESLPARCLMDLNPEDLPCKECQSNPKIKKYRPIKRNGAKNVLQ